MRAWLIVFTLAAATTAAAQDADRDGLSDALEQSLLDRFTPTLLLAHDECDGVPASFVPFNGDPLVVAKDGTLYGQAFALDAVDGRSRIELHFFHLW